MEPNEILALWEKSLAYIALEHLNTRGKKGLAEMADMSRQWVAAFLAHGEPISQPTFEKMKAAMDAYNKEQAEYLRNLPADDRVRDALLVLAELFKCKHFPRDIKIKRLAQFVDGFNEARGIDIKKKK